MRKLTKVKALEQDLVCFAKFDKFMETKINFRIRLCLAMDKWKKNCFVFYFLSNWLDLYLHYDFWKNKFTFVPPNWLGIFY